MCAYMLPERRINTTEMEDSLKKGNERERREEKTDRQTIAFQHNMLPSLSRCRQNTLKSRCCFAVHRSGPCMKIPRAAPTTTIGVDPDKLILVFHFFWSNILNVHIKRMQIKTIKIQVKGN